jgi:hypothetical protein
MRFLCWDRQIAFPAIQAIGVVRTSRLARRVCSVLEHDDLIIKAIDHLLLGS